MNYNTGTALCMNLNSLKRQRTNFKDDTNDLYDNNVHCKCPKLMKGPDDLCFPFDVDLDLQLYPHSKSKVLNKNGHLSDPDVLRDDVRMKGQKGESQLPVLSVNPAHPRQVSFPGLSSSMRPNQASLSQERTFNTCPECAAGKSGHFQHIHLGGSQVMDMS